MLCDRKSHIKTHVRDHIEAVHFESKQCACQYCGKLFKNRMSLRVHHSRNHRELRKTDKWGLRRLSLSLWTITKLFYIAVICHVCLWHIFDIKVAACILTASSMFAGKGLVIFCLVWNTVFFWSFFFFIYIICGTKRHKFVIHKIYLNLQKQSKHEWNLTRTGNVCDFIFLRHFLYRYRTNECSDQ